MEEILKSFNYEKGCDKSLLYFMDNKDKTDTLEDFDDSFIYTTVDTLGLINNTYSCSIDDICRIFNYLNFYSEDKCIGMKKGIVNLVNSIGGDVEKAFKEALEVSYNKGDYAFVADYERTMNFNTYGLCLGGMAFISSLISDEKVLLDIFSDNRHNMHADEMLDKNVEFVYNVPINGNLYTLISVHGGGDLRGGYYNFFMVRGDMDDIPFWGLMPCIRVELKGDKENELYKKICNKFENLDGVYYIDENTCYGFSDVGSVNLCKFMKEDVGLNDEEYDYLKNNCRIHCYILNI